MRIEAHLGGLTKAKRSKLAGLASFDEATGIAVFEWGAAGVAPHDYPTAMNRVRDDVAALGGEATNFRMLG